MMHAGYNCHPQLALPGTTHDERGGKISQAANNSSFSDLYSGSQLLEQQKDLRDWLKHELLGPLPEFLT